MCLSQEIEVEGRVSPGAESSWLHKTAKHPLLLTLPPTLLWFYLKTLRVKGLWEEAVSQLSSLGCCFGGEGWVSDSCGPSTPVFTTATPAGAFDLHWWYLQPACGINLWEWCEVGTQAHFPPMWTAILPSYYLLTEWPILLFAVSLLLYNTLPYVHCSISGLCILFHCSFCLPPYFSFIINLCSCPTCPIGLALLPQTVLPILGPLFFHKHFRISVSSSTKKLIDIWIGITLTL